MLPFASRPSSAPWCDLLAFSTRIRHKMETVETAEYALRSTVCVSDIVETNRASTVRSPFSISPTDIVCLARLNRRATHRSRALGCLCLQRLCNFYICLVTPSPCAVASGPALIPASLLLFSLFSVILAILSTSHILLTGCNLFPVVSSFFFLLFFFLHAFNVFTSTQCLSPSEMQDPGLTQTGHPRGLTCFGIIFNSSR